MLISEIHGLTHVCSAGFCGKSRSRVPQTAVGGLTYRFLPPSSLGVYPPRTTPARSAKSELAMSLGTQWAPQQFPAFMRPIQPLSWPYEVCHSSLMSVRIRITYTVRLHWMRVHTGDDAFAVSISGRTRCIRGSIACSKIHYTTH